MKVKLSFLNEIDEDPC